MNIFICLQCSSMRFGLNVSGSMNVFWMDDRDDVVPLQCGSSSFTRVTPTVCSPARRTARHGTGTAVV